MIPSIRQKYNQEFTEAKYNNYLAALENNYSGCIEFRIAETPLLFPIVLKINY